MRSIIGFRTSPKGPWGEDGGVVGGVTPGASAAADDAVGEAGLAGGSAEPGSPESERFPKVLDLEGTLLASVGIAGSGLEREDFLGDVGGVLDELVPSGFLLPLLGATSS